MAVDQYKLSDNTYFTHYVAGHPKSKGDRKISQLKQVSALNVKDVSIVMVKCSDAATVVVTKSGEIYVLHEYQCRKIASK